MFEIIRNVGHRGENIKRANTESLISRYAKRNNRVTMLIRSPMATANANSGHRVTVR